MKKIDLEQEERKLRPSVEEESLRSNLLKVFISNFDKTKFSTKCFLTLIILVSVWIISGMPMPVTSS